MKTERMSTRAIEAQLRKYIDDAIALASGKPFGSTNCYLDGIESPAGLAPAIKELGEAYFAKLQALAKAAPTVRGDTISIYEPKPKPEANAPSREDEAFLSACRKQYLEHGFVRARDADTYEEIAKRYPDYAHPARLRGSEAKRWRALHDADAVTRKIKQGTLLRRKRK